MLNQFSRTELLLGREGVERLARAHVAVFGLGGVGGYAAEALVRSGVGALDLIDSDRVSLTNLNRQILATHRTLGQYKADAARDRALEINPEARVTARRVFYGPDTAGDFDFSQYDYVIDAIDTVTGKLALIQQALAAGTPIISCMGAGNKLDPTAFRVADNSEGHLRAAFTQMLFYGQAEIERGGLILSALGDLIASYMLAYRDSARFSPPVEKLRSVIIWNYADPGFALDQAIRALPFHYDYLRKIFKRETGQTPLEYMTRLRMKKAERMLSGMPDMDFSVAEIAALCGYDNPLYFSRVFKKHFGASPTAYAGGRRRGNMSVL